ncbi:MAG TPA: membrane protein insertase YidC [Caulobacteraceae bacterium]|nr:membrane protein insertase YidC [Caulobacteraceae bacterium]
MKNDNRNFLIFVLVLLPLLVLYELFVVEPIQKKHQAEQAQAQVQAQAAAAIAKQAGVPLGANGQPVAVALPLARALAASPRVAIRTPSLTGSIGLRGAGLDDLFLCGTNPRPGDPTCYHQSVAAGSPPVDLLRPLGAADAYFAVLGWQGSNLTGLPDEDTLWTQASAGPLTPEHPLELTYASPAGLLFHRQIAVDKLDLFTVTDTVRNQGAAPVTIEPYGSVQRRGLPPDLGKVNIVHEGAIGVLGGTLREAKYAAWKKSAATKQGVADQYSSTGGWLGITDKYWMTTFIPPQNEPVQAQFRVTQPGGLVDDYETAYTGQPRLVAPGATVSEVTHVFAGAKVVATLNAYGQALHAPHFVKAVDWGILEVLTKPMFELLDFYARHLANFGLAILALTVTIRVLLFPIFNASYAMSTKMKKVQPQMKALQEKHKNDQQALQKETMALYQREKINPVTGCIPMLVPIPVFFSLYKVFTVTIEMRHAHFLWIKDLSAPDQTTIWNLFGLIPWDPFTNGVVEAAMHLPFVGGIVGLIMHLGAWPIIYGVTMWLTQLTGPPMTGVDPTQQKLLRLMPFIFMFLFTQYTVGIVIYWSFSSVFTMTQQYVLMRRFKVDNPIDAFFARFAHKASG